MEGITKIGIFIELNGRPLQVVSSPENKKLALELLGRLDGGNLQAIEIEPFKVVPVEK